MKKLLVLGFLFTQSVLMACASGDSVSVNLKNARRTINYNGAMVVDGQTVTLTNQELTATEGNQIAVLVVNGGRLVLDHCKIVKSGDGIRSNSGSQERQQMRQRPGGDRRMRHEGDSLRSHRSSSNRQMRQSTQEYDVMAPPEGNREMGEGQDRMRRPEGDSLRTRRPRGNHSNASGGQGGNRRERRGGQGGPGGGGGGGDDSFNFYGLNSAVVAVGANSRITMIGCEVQTDAEYANAVFACDSAAIIITEGIKIRTSKGSSRGLYATCAGIVNATGVVDISTQGAHCAALATDRGGGTVTVGTPGTSSQSLLYTAGEGSPCIYSTGDITAHNALGEAKVSQTMVVEGKNMISITDCNLAGHSPKHGGIMLYQSTSGDADEGTSVLNMRDCTIRDNSGTTMLLVTNTHSIVNMENCTLLDAQGKEIAKDYPLVTCRNCNNDGHNWGREGSNGGQVNINLVQQKLAGTLLANETESRITVTADKKSDLKQLVTAEGKGTITLP